MKSPIGSIIRSANRVLLEEGRSDAVEEFFAPTYVAHVTGRDLDGGPVGVRRYLAMVRKAFPEVRVEVEILVESGNRVAWQRTLRGAQSGAYAGFPASGRDILWRDMVVSELRDELIVEEWVVSDLAEQLLLARKKPRG